MTLENFMELHDGGVACVSIYEYTNGKKHQYCEEENQEDILDAEWFEKNRTKGSKAFLCYRWRYVQSRVVH